MTTSEALDEEAEIAYETFYLGLPHTLWEELPRPVRRRWRSVCVAIHMHKEQRGPIK